MDLSHAGCIRHLIIQNSSILAIRNTIPVNRVKPVNCGSESASEKWGERCTYDNLEEQLASALLFPLKQLTFPWILLGRTTFCS
jgi:hypothetical protein